MAVPSSLVIFLSCINVTLYNFWARIIKIVVVVVVVDVVKQSLVYNPGIVNRTFENRTQSNSIELNPWIEFD